MNHKGFLVLVSISVTATSTQADDSVPFHIITKIERTIQIPCVPPQSGTAQTNPTPPPSSENKEADNSSRIDLKFAGVDKQLHIFSVEVEGLSKEAKLTLGLGYEEREKFDGEIGTTLTLPPGRHLRTASGKVDANPQYGYVCFVIGPKEALTFILDTEQLKVVHSWRSRIEFTPLASRNARLEQDQKQQFRWIEKL
jgi:hypothetical protein